MDNWLWELVPWGYEVLLQVEGYRTSLLDAFFSGVTFLGSEWFYIFFLALIYWCVGKELGLGIAYVYLLSTYVNDWLKHHFAIPRPIDPALHERLAQAGTSGRLEPLFHETSPSWPSNHTQGAVVTWGYFASWWRRKWAWNAAALLAFLIAFSRLYGGGHFPQDVIGGLVLGLLFLTAWLAAESRAVAWLLSRRFAVLLAISIILPLLGMLLVPSDASTQIMGTLIGMGGGYLVETRTTNFQVAGSWWKRLLRALLGLVMVIIVYLGLKALFGLVDDPPIRLILRGVRYAAMGLTASIAAPWLFIRLGLAERNSPLFNAATLG